MGPELVPPEGIRPRASLNVLDRVERMAFMLPVVMAVARTRAGVARVVRKRPQDTWRGPVVVQ